TPAVARTAAHKATSGGCVHRPTARQANSRESHQGGGLPYLFAVPGATPLMQLRLLTLADLDDLPDPEWLVDGLVGESALAVLFGTPGVGKSFLALDLAMSVATGRPWLGQETKPGGVVYVYAEGTTGLKHRTQAWRLKRGNGSAPIAFLPQALDLTDATKR